MNIEELKKDSFLLVSNWWGLGPRPGFNGYSIDQNGQLIKFSSILYGEEEKNEIIYNLSPEELLEFKKYLTEEENVFTTDYKNHMIFDMGTTINVKIDGQEKEIRNESKEFNETEDKLYDRIIKKIEDLVSKTK